ncbi:hypothetical protein [Primorskyibacter flagellatus]|uniref:hypothetical protein n=1 Tax=Primorskyibacter flagellatus TaxID=1387277 RepID=UPI003A926FEC
MFRHAAAIVLLPALLVLSACASDLTKEEISARRAAAGQVHKMAETPSAVQSFLSDTTTKSHSIHGTQIEYLAANGETFLWYPGNNRGVSGRWKLQIASYGLEICFLYGEGSYNPVTRERGGSWKCDMAAYYILKRDEIVSGNPFRLSRKIPYVLPKKIDISLDQAMRSSGFGPLRQKNRAPVPQYPDQG